jgi:ABC-type multidrug transport system fused ATPase/permease subunit
MLDKGEVVDEGTYDGLMEKNEQFRALAKVPE